MDVIKEIEKEAMRELAWKELIAAIKPGELFRKTAKKSTAVSNTKAVYHPAVVTDSELGNWELFS